MKKLMFVVLSLLLVFSMASCSVDTQTKDLMKGFTSKKVENSDDLKSGNADVTDFSIRLFKASEQKGKNTLISPLSVMYAMSMTANGAHNQTLSQIESTFGMSIDELNLYLYSYTNSLPNNDKNGLSIANSIWFSNNASFSVKRDFLQTNANYYGADIYKAPFNQQTCNDINNWVKVKTHDMIPKVIDELQPDDLMCLFNAIAFEGEWMLAYEDKQIKTGNFTTEEGTKQKAEFMYDIDSYYIEDDNATGFIKPYKDERYAFVALLPRENVSISNYIASLDGKKISSLLENYQHACVHTAIPKFETTFNIKMVEALKSVGITDAFDFKKADFSDIGTSKDGNLYISNVIHKTHISVDEKGTKAAAATGIMVAGGSAEPQKEVQVYLDKPFVYMIIDKNNNLPLFMGTLMSVNE